MLEILRAVLKRAIIRYWRDMIYTQYTTDGLFETDFQYKQFDDDRCLP